MKKMITRIKQIVFALFLIVATTSSISAIDYSAEYNQLWSKQYGDVNIDQLVSVVQTKDGGYVAAGSYEDLSTDITYGWVMKIDKDGNEIWSNHYNLTSHFSMLYRVEETSDGGFIVAGVSYFDTASTEYGWLLRLDANGNEIWSNQYGIATSIEVLVSVKQTSDGGFIAAGYTDGTLPGNISYGLDDGWVLRVDANGNEIWSNQYGSAGSDRIEGIIITDDNHFVAVGATTGSVTDGTLIGIEDGWMLKVDSSGNEVWSKQYGSPAVDTFNSIIQTSTGNYLAVGQAGAAIGDNTFSGGVADTWLTEINPSGNEVWTKMYGSSGDDGLVDITSTKTGDYVAVGYTTGDMTITNLSASSKMNSKANIGGYDGLVLKVDSSGNLLWSNQYGTPETDVLEGVIQSADGSYVAVGYTQGSVTDGTNYGSFDGWILKLEGDLEYQLNFDANGGTGKMNSIELKRNTTITLPANSFTYKGYDFVGWSTDKNATQNLIAGENTIKNTIEYVDKGSYTHTATEDVTLYAVWQKVADQNDNDLPDTGNTVMSYIVILTVLSILVLWFRKKLI